MFFLSRDFCLLIFRKNWIIKKSSKNKNIDQNNEKNIENNMILLFFIIIFPFCKNNLQKCFKNPFLDMKSDGPGGSSFFAGFVLTNEFVFRNGHVVPKPAKWR